MAEAIGLMLSVDEDPSEFYPAPRAAAFRAARRHSLRVRWLKIGILGASAFGVAGLLFVWIYNPLSRIPADISIGRGTLNGSQITMENPKLTGYKRDGRPYELIAASGVQDIKTPSVVQLNQIEAHVTMPDESVVRLVAPLGVYDSVKDFMRLPKDVRVTSNSGYDARLESAEVDFKAGTILSHDPVTVATRSATIAANTLLISDSGSVVVFTGDVRSTLIPQAGADAAGKDAR